MSETAVRCAARLFSAFCLSFAMAALSAAAEPAPDRLDLLQSGWHAERSHDLLLSGDRAEAILAALRGIPADPDQQDAETYGPAFDALWRAVASFAFRAEFDTALALHFSPDGSRALGFPATSGLGSFSDETVKLWNTADGSVVAELSDPSALTAEFGFAYYGHESPVSPFSNDGRMVAVSETNAAAPSSMQGRVVVFEADTGREVARVAGDSFHGFSADGRIMMVGALYEARFVLYDTTSWSTLAEIGPLGPPGTHSVGFPGSDGAFYAVTSRQDGAPEVTQLWRMDLSGAQPVADLTDIRGYTESGLFPVPFASPESPYMALDTPAGDLVILALDGRRMAQVPGAGATELGFAFVRNGQAVAVLPFHFGLVPLEGDLAIYGLDGTRLEPLATDLAPFLDLMASRDDARQRSVSYGPRRHASPVWPTGVDLYTQIWPQIPTALQAQIDAERITRPE